MDEFFEMPTKGALTQSRDKISYRFFEDQFNVVKSDFKKIQRKFKGLYVYGIDGDIYSIPRNKKTEGAGFYGCPIPAGKETHFLRMYTVSAVDVFSGIPVEFAYGTRCMEIDLAVSILGNLEKNSICIYDRLYFSKKIVLKHRDGNNFFLCRLHKNSIRESKDLYKNTEQEKSSRIFEGVKIRLVKIKNKKTEDEMVFATNLPEEEFTNQDLEKLYFKRWESETSNRDSTDTLKLEQFHSQNINGILQEIFVHLWFVCFSKMQILKYHKIKEKDLLKDEYKRCNYKEVMAFIIQNIPEILINKFRMAYKKLKYIILKSIEKRTHNSRSNPRISKNHRQPYRGNHTFGKFNWPFEILSPKRTPNQVFMMNHC